MQRRPRRVSPKQRNPRTARNPAYQIRPRYHLAPDSAPANHTQPWTIEEPPDSEWRKPDEQDEPAPDPEETSFQPQVSDDQEQPPEAEPSADEPFEAEPDVEDDETDSDADEEADAAPQAVEGAAEAAEPEDFSTYVRKIEEAAARSRSARRGEALAGRRPMARGDVHPATAITSSHRAAARPQRQGAPRTSGRGGGRRRGGPPAVQKPFFKRRKTWFILLALIVLIPAIVVGAYFANVAWVGWNAYDKLHTEPIGDREVYGVNAQGTPVVVAEDVESTLPDWDAKEVVNIVLMGVDVRPGDVDPERSDTIIVVHVDPKSGEMAMMSIPRDLLVFIPGFGDEKMNAAYAIGEAHEDTIPGGGPTLVAQTIEANFNIPIHYYATVDFKGFEKIVDTVGGVVVDVQAQLSDNQYPTEDLRLTRVYFPTGPQKMDGHTALRYVRTRHADSDLARGQRQQEVLLAIRERAVVRDLITKAADLIEDMGDAVRTDLNFNQLLALANLGRQTDPTQIARIDLWQQGFLTEHMPEFDGDAYYLEADWPKVQELQAQYFEVPEPEPTATDEAVTGAATTPGTEQPQEAAATPTEAVANLDTPVMVENGTAITMLAGHTVQFLFDSGFTAVWASDAEQPAESTVIYDNSGSPETAEHVAELLGFPPSIIVPQEEGNGDIVVVLGDDFTAVPEVTPES